MNPPRRKLPSRLVLGLVLAVLFDTALQLVWKSAALELPAGGGLWSFARAVLQNRLLLLVIGLMTLQFFNWLAVLGDADLSYAQPVTSVSYVLVLGLSAWFFHETADPVQILGVALVLVGVWFISRTAHVTPPSPAPRNGGAA